MPKLKKIILPGPMETEIIVRDVVDIIYQDVERSSFIGNEDIKSEYTFTIVMKDGFGHLLQFGEKFARDNFMNEIIDRLKEEGALIGEEKEN